MLRSGRPPRIGSRIRIARAAAPASPERAAQLVNGTAGGGGAGGRCVNPLPNGDAFLAPPASATSATLTVTLQADPTSQADDFELVVSDPNGGAIVKDVRGTRNVTVEFAEKDLAPHAVLKLRVYPCGLGNVIRVWDGEAQFVLAQRS